MIATILISLIVGIGIENRFDLLPKQPVKIDRKVK